MGLRAGDPAADDCCKGDGIAPASVATLSLKYSPPSPSAPCHLLQEESGVPVHLPSVRYVVSQPWPFPRSLMIGFYCQAKKTQSDNTGEH